MFVFNDYCYCTLMKGMCVFPNKGHPKDSFILEIILVIS